MTRHLGEIGTGQHQMMYDSLDSCDIFHNRVSPRGTIFSCPTSFTSPPLRATSNPPDLRDRADNSLRRGSPTALALTSTCAAAS